MKTIGYNRPVCVRPFDHRGSFQTRMCRAKGEQFIETGSDSVLVHWEG
jgi:hypothetical protein